MRGRTVGAHSGQGDDEVSSRPGAGKLLAARVGQSWKTELT